jgi:hypothetical protein
VNRAASSASISDSSDDQPAVADAPERHELVVLDQHHEPDPVAVELPNGAEVGRGEHHIPGSRIGASYPHRHLTPVEEDQQAQLVVREQGSLVDQRGWEGDAMAMARHSPEGLDQGDSEIDNCSNR